ncbi:MAG: metal ABC transporter permease [Candidatus Saccharicenans sp.]|jgi:zinc transport system permease protein|nr:metal ABC transporter permease [Candidatus Saccharicenans sp.]MDH7493377.1 metal ABC transporter permease [Candidatus Saccharicenans sp.]
MSQSLLFSGLLLRAVVAGSLLGLACGLLGVFLVLRRDAMISHGLSHLAFAGVALGLLLNLMPVLVSVGICLLGSLLILQLKEQGKLPGDTLIGILSSAGMALAIFLMSVKRDFGAELVAYLFGDILAIAPLEVYLAAGLVCLVLAGIFFNFPRLVFMTFDRDSAAASGIPVKKLDRLLVVLTAVTIVLGIRVVGLLLVTGLTVIPAASALQLSPNFRLTLFLSSIFSLLSIIGGILLAYLFNLPASAAIIFLALFLFGLSFLFKKLS